MANSIPPALDKPVYPLKTPVYRHEPLTHCQQAEGMACIAACLQMLTREDFSVCKRFVFGEYMHGIASIEDFLAGYGIDAYDHPSAGIHQLDRPQVYLLCVPSLQTPGMFHQIILDNRIMEHPVIFDPTMGIPGKKYYVMPRTDGYKELEFPMLSFIIDYKVILPTCEFLKNGE